MTTSASIASRVWANWLNDEGKRDEFRRTLEIEIEQRLNKDRIVWVGLDFIPNPVLESVVIAVLGEFRGCTSNSPTFKKANVPMVVSKNRVCYYVGCREVVLVASKSDEYHKAKNDYSLAGDKVIDIQYRLFKERCYEELHRAEVELEMARRRFITASRAYFAESAGAYEFLNHERGAVHFYHEYEPLQIRVKRLVSFFGLLFVTGNKTESVYEFPVTAEDGFGDALELYLTDIGFIEFEDYAENEED